MVFLNCFRADVSMFALRTYLHVSLPSAVRVLLRDTFCTPQLFKDAWTLLNIPVVHS